MDPVSNIDYSSIETVRNSVPASDLNNIEAGETDRFFEIDRKAQDYAGSIPASVTDREGYKRAMTALDRSRTILLTAEEKDSLRSYSSSEYHNINGILREGTTYLYYDQYTGGYTTPRGGSIDVQKTLRDIKNIDAVIARSESPAMRLYRKCDVGSEFKGIRGARMGTVYRQIGYTSSTISEKAAIDFKKSGTDLEVIEILFPGGNGGGAFMTGNTAWEDEFEYLMKRGSRHKLVQKSDSINSRYVFKIIP